MEKNINKEMITERSDNMGLKSNISKNIPIDFSQNSLLSSDLVKKGSDHKTNEIKQLNLPTERSICLSRDQKMIFLNRETSIDKTSNL